MLKSPLFLFCFLKTKPHKSPQIWGAGSNWWLSPMAKFRVQGSDSREQALLNG